MRDNLAAGGNTSRPPLFHGLSAVAVSTHNLALDAEGNAYAAVITQSADLPTTPGAFQAKFAGTNDRRWGNGDRILARFRPARPAEQGPPAAADLPSPTASARHANPRR
ncbi:MAG: hypothetical protein AMK72_00635 [Planctomycetes bacterium SM23_25]|jgi:hypothetical protein|nr:MAG: hypothetical protein AMK72_00635 [Planctomycetes bacterium SM23_25]